MKSITSKGKRFSHLSFIFLFLPLFLSFDQHKPEDNPLIRFTLSMPAPATHLFHVIINCRGLKTDSVSLKMPRWTPGYYQIMDFPERVKNFSAFTDSGKPVTAARPDQNTWLIVPGRNNPFSVQYDVLADRKFVACNYLDTTHAYIIPAATFMYPEGYIDASISIKLMLADGWNGIATGLDAGQGKSNEFIAPGFDILYDCPLLAGKLDELLSFTVNGVSHRFITWGAGDFDGEELMSGLRKIVEASAELMGDIPYRKYTFIGTGPGYGGIEHLNNTTVSFSAAGIYDPGAMTGMLKFLAHEYFHSYNVKRIRPYELGPFDYNRENRTNLLWFSEGATVYYEYLLVRRAGLMSDDDLIASIESNINAFENDPGKQYQSLSQASYNTWSDGPFGRSPDGQDRAISYYDKGPVVAMIIDFTIRNATENKKSLDDVMRYLYREYYKKPGRGFTDAELQEACELIAGIPMAREFEYVNTTRPVDYSMYLSYAGLKISVETGKNTSTNRFKIEKEEYLNAEQKSLFNSWAGTKPGLSSGKLPL